MGMHCPEIRKNLSDLCQMVENLNMEISRLGKANIFVFFFSLFIYFILSLFSRSKHAYSKISRVMEIMRSVLAGVTFSLLFKEKHVKVIHLNPFKNIDHFLTYNFATLLLSGVLLFTIFGIYVYRKFNHDFSNDEMKSSLSKKTDNRSSNYFFSIYNDVKRFTVHIKEKFNEYYAPISYLSLIFSYAILAGLGFDGRQYIGLYEIIVLIHKIYEIFRLKEIMNKSCTNIEDYLWFGFAMFLNTSFGILFRRHLMKDMSFNQNEISQMFQNAFFQSFIFMFFVENLFPFSKSFGDMITNLLITVISYTVFNYNLKVKCKII